ncbi:hypothetical protein SEUBUCD646_0B05920 [Saccharomyces eubayanus]|uniref:CNH domain-containing protein n=1 Tax=Saccharomyces eubayanus TaxID=1080349 RepID=A0ABN8VW04_SACEU|nr:hypothetical protein SEUBUCD650_0B05920 [Saccharomyces eubayanus]CAI1896536.1 hypothetical protein SEUBUCD646_0B05920 [Saccharomyces eubayanus]
MAKKKIKVKNTKVQDNDERESKIGIEPPHEENDETGTKDNGQETLEGENQQSSLHSANQEGVEEADKFSQEESRSTDNSSFDKDTTREAIENDVTKEDTSGTEAGMSTNDNQKEDLSLKINEGPFRLSTVLENVPSDLAYTCCEAYDNHIFLGTTTGDLLHYFELERGNYMLVSQTKFDADSDAKIDKILLLPKVEGALILCNNELVLFILPEFAPRPNTVRLRGINDVLVCNFSRSSNAYRIYAFHAEGIRLLKISANSLVFAKTFNFKLIDKACAHEQTLMISKLNNYELVNLKSSQVIPLFRISETDEELEPIITNFNDDNEFLVCSGGGSYENGAMALVVNHHGDIIKGTMLLKNYPRKVIVEFPYIIVDSGFQSVDIYSALSSEESQLLQSITNPKIDLKISRTDKVFTNANTSEEFRKKISNKLRLQPLTHSDNKFRIERERALVEESYEEKSSLVIYNNLGIHLLVPKPMVLSFTSYDESEIDNIEDQLKKLSRRDLTKFQKIEAKYLMSLLLFLMMLHYDHIEDEVMKKWCEFSDKVDIRILFYLLGWKVYSEIWCFRGLVDIVEQLKSLKLSNKCENVIKMILMIKSDLKKRDKNGILVTDFSDIMKSIDITLLGLQLDSGSEVTIDMFEQESFDEIIKEIYSRGDDISRRRLLIDIHKEKGEYVEPLKLLKRAKDYKSLISFIEENIRCLPEEYVKETLNDDLIISLRQGNKNADSNSIKQVLKILDIAGISKNEFLDRIPEEGISLKVSFIEELGVQNSKDSKFLFNYYLTKLQEIISKDKIWFILDDFIKEYKDDLAYDKTDITSFIDIKLKHSVKCERFSKYYGKCENLKIENIEDSEFIKFTFGEISKIDRDHILCLLFFSNDLIKWISPKELLKVYLSFNDFRSVEKFTDKPDLIAVMKQYLKITSLNYSVELISNLLRRNFSLLDDIDTQLMVLETIPSDFPMQSISELLLKMIIQYQDKREDSNLRKFLLKNQISISDELNRNFEAQE